MPIDLITAPAQPPTRKDVGLCPTGYLTPISGHPVGLQLQLAGLPAKAGPAAARFVRRQKWSEARSFFGRRSGHGQFPPMLWLAMMLLNQQQPTLLVAV